MATVPVNLGYGQVLIYGSGLATGVMGFSFESSSSTLLQNIENTIATLGIAPLRGAVKVSGIRRS